MIAVRAVQAPSAWTRARELIVAYARSLAIDLSFQDLSQELDTLELIFGAPDGVFFVAEDAADSFGCVGVRRISAEDCEMKRLYIVPQARSRGIGRLLAARAIEAAAELGYRRMLLDTLPSMHGAAFMALELPSARVTAVRSR